MGPWIVDDELSERYPVWTRGNVGEVFPEVVSPLTWSLYGQAADLGWRDAFTAFGALGPADFDAPSVPNVVGVFGGYAYLNVSSTRLFAHRTPLVAVADIDRSLFGEQDAPPWSPPPGARNLGRSLAALRALLKTVGLKAAPPEVGTDAAATDAWVAAQPPVPTASDDALVAAATDFQARFRSLFCRHIFVSFQASVATSVVGQAARRAFGDENLVPALIAGIGDVESAAPSQALWALSRQADPSIADFVARFGYRGPNEWDLGATTWDNNEAGVRAAIDALRRADDSHDPSGQQSRLARERTDATERLLAALPRRARGQFRRAQRAAIVLARARETTKSTIIRAIHGVRVPLRELARRGRDPGGPPELDRFFLLTASELPDYLRKAGAWVDRLAERAAHRDELAALVPPFVFTGSPPGAETWARRDAAVATVTTGTVIVGIGACPGVATGRARVVLDPFDPGGLGPGDVLIAPITDPSWTPLFLPAEAVVVDVGAPMSHAVIVSRELGIPAVVSATGATTTIPDGALIEVDGTAGTVTILEISRSHGG